MPSMDTQKPSPLLVRTLLVEDESESAILTTRRLDWSPDANFQVDCESSLGDAMRRLEREHYDVVLLDVGLPDCDGISTLAHASLVSRHVPIVVLSGRDEMELQDAAREAGLPAYLLKMDQDSRTLSQALLGAIHTFRAPVD